jgi:hypothetical protein
VYFNRNSLQTRILIMCENSNSYIETNAKHIMEIYRKMIS